MDAVSGYSAGSYVSFDLARRATDSTRPTGGPAAAGKTSGVEHGPAVMFGGALASIGAVAGVNPVSGGGRALAVTPVPPVKPVVYRPGALVNISA